MAKQEITHVDIVKDLQAKKYKPVYYLMGDEDYYIDKLSDAIVDAALSAEERDFNLDILYGSEADADKAIAICRQHNVNAFRCGEIVEGSGKSQVVE